MLNKPKFMSPSINMQGNTVIDLNSETLPFSCIVDGNEAVVAWQIVVSNLKDNTIVFDSGKQELSSPFYPINNRNQNVVFSKNLKDYFASATTCYISAESTYDSEKVYYTYSDNVYSEYTYDASTWSTDYKSLYYTNFVNKETPYYWAITLWGKTGTETHSAEEVFYANSIPKTTIYYSYDNNFLNDKGVLDDNLILNNDTSLGKRKIFLKATYIQDENISLKRYGWRLTDISNGVVVLDTITQNQIYGVEEDISCECNGLINKTNYLVELYVETQNGYFNILQAVKFDIDYVVKNIEADFEIMSLNNSSGIMLNFGNLKTTEGVIIGDSKSVSYTNNFPIVSYDSNGNENGSVSIEIPDDTEVVFAGNANGKDLEIDENSYVILSFQFDKTRNITLFEMSGTDKYSNEITRKLSYTSSDRVLKYTITKGNIVVYCTEVLSDIISERCWYIATLYPLFTDNGNYTNLKLIESIANNGLYPSEDLYPSNDLYPYFGNWDKLREE